MPNGFARRGSWWPNPASSYIVTAGTLFQRFPSQEENLAIHYIQNFERFDEAVQVAAPNLQEQSSTHWHEAILKAGYSHDRANELEGHLEQNRQDLKLAIEKMRSVLL